MKLFIDLFKNLSPHLFYSLNLFPRSKNQ